MPGIPHVGLDPIPRWALQLRRRRDLARDALPRQESGQPEPGRPGLVGHYDRPGQPPNPGDDLAVIRAQPALEQLPGLPVQAARHHRTGVHVQSDTRTIRQHWGLPHLWLYRPGPVSCRQPTFTCGEAPARTSIPSKHRAELVAWEGRQAVRSSRQEHEASGDHPGHRHWGTPPYWASTPIWRCSNAIQAHPIDRRHGCRDHGRERGDRCIRSPRSCGCRREGGVGCAAEGAL